MSSVENGILSGPTRSEEHTSELQSQSNLVCRLLLEKKKHQIAPLGISVSPASRSTQLSRLPKPSNCCAGCVNRIPDPSRHPLDPSCRPSATHASGK